MLEIILCVLIFVGDSSVIARDYKFVTNYKNSFDQDLYARVLDENKCMRQLRILFNDTLGLQFLDASAKAPSGFRLGNVNDLGDYFECLDINQVVNEVDIQGKYCMVTVPLTQDFLANRDSAVWSDVVQWLNLVGLPGNGSVDQIKMYSAKATNRFKNYVYEITGFGPQDNTSFLYSPLNPFIMNLGICIPHACTTKQVLDFLTAKNVSVLNVTYTENYCRLPNDKPITTGDYVAFIIFAIIGAITIASTSYDVYNVLILKKDKSEINKLYQSFSVYTNTRRLVTLHKTPGAVECMDGIRTISMLWVIVGHTYALNVLSHVHNIMYLLEWTGKFSSTWINAAPLTVDTFFFLSGMLCVYSTVGKFSRGSFVKNIHLYYLLRLLRIFPLLAAVVLLQASLINHVSDGPSWVTVASSTEICKHYWWSALLHVQNYVNQKETCLGPTWYLSVDVQLYIVSPLIIVWLFGKKYLAWTALIIGVILSLVATSYYSFTYNFSSVVSNPSRYGQYPEYSEKYYTNTVVRASPFFVGMAMGYLLHLYRDKVLNISKVSATLLWLLSLLTMAFCILSAYPVVQPDHDLQLFDNFLNSYMRAMWAGALGWLIIACFKGYGGPVNWFLSLQMWKVPARLSYGMYLLHGPIIMIMQGTWVKTYYMSDLDIIYRFLANAVMSFTMSFILTVLIDSPFTTLLKLFLSGKVKPEMTKAPKLQPEKNGEQTFYKTSF